MVFTRSKLSKRACASTDRPGSAHVLTPVKNGETSVFVAIDHDECGDLTDVKKYQRVDALA